jgi:TolB-like protein/DNA-binding winged helix-turn-helix (wHTH) protein
MATVYVLGPFRLDVQSELLCRGTEPVTLGRRAIALLRALIERPGAVVSKDALIDAGWSGQAVEESNLTVQIAALRRALGEEPGGDRWIETMPRRGYRFVGPIVTKEENGAIAAAVQVDTAPTRRGDPERRQITVRFEPAPESLREWPLALPDKPSLAVLPFQNLSGDPEQEYFTDGMVEEIITALARIRWLFVVAASSSFTYKGKAVDVRRIGRELGVRYLLEGSVRKAGGRVRITAQLIEAATGAHLWADRFDGSLEGVFELQDQVAISVAGVIEPALEGAEIRRSAERPTNDVTAYDLYLRALALSFSWGRDDTTRALGLLEQAIERDPRYGLALIEAASRYTELHVNGWYEDPEAIRRTGVELSRQALQVAGDDPNVLSKAARALAYFGEDIGAAIALLDRSLTLNPNSTRAWMWGGWIRLWAGQPDLAITHFETSVRLNPRVARTNPLMGIGVAHFFARRFEEAKAALLGSLQEKPDWVPSYRFLAACYAQMGRLDEAEETVKRLRTLTNAVIPSVTHWRNAEQRELFLSGLRLAAGGHVTPP